MLSACRIVAWLRHWRTMLHMTTESITVDPGPSDHTATALTLVAQVEECQDHLNDLYELPSEERDGNLVASLHRESGAAMKLAEIHAMLAVAQQLKALREDRSAWLTAGGIAVR